MPLPLCEPVRLAPGAIARVARVEADADSPPTAPLRHFHPAGEIVLFTRVGGTLIHEHGSHAIATGSLVYLPPLHCHDFMIDGGARAWWLIQFDGDAARAAGAPVPGAVIASTPDQTAWARLLMLAEWLAESQGDAAAARMTALLWAVAEQPALTPAEPAPPQTMARYRPLLDRLHAMPDRAPTLTDAATLCQLSPTYFSRRFEAVFGVGYPAYVRSLRLNLASRRLLEGGESAATIAYDLGFASPAHFSNRFKAHFGVTPTAFRRGDGFRHAACA
jgi:AraC-like DNA-binding protein